MSLFDLLWNLDQERQLKEVREQIEKTSSGRTVQQLEEEVAELKLKLGLLVRLLIQKEAISAEEYASLIAQALDPADEK